MRPRTALSIAGSDSGGGAGIQADLKAFARSGVHGMTAITAITVQNTKEVRSVSEVDPAVVIEQVAAVAEDIGVDAVKIGMLGSVAMIEAVTSALDHVGSVPVVVDPVMVSESGSVLLPADAIDALRDTILPLASVLTPNLPEARTLLSSGPDESAEELARGLRELGPRAVVVTGGHAERACDVLLDGESLTEIEGDRHPDGAAHGSGCTHSATLAAQLALGADTAEAARTAKRIASEAVRVGLAELGAGAGPVDAIGIAAPVGS